MRFLRKYEIAGLAVALRISWPGTSTAALTVLIAGLSTTGATNQKMLFRIVGAIIGGVVFGIGCIVCVYPFADTALPFLLSVACVSFLGAWIARSAHLGYVGLQIVFSFYLVAFQEYGVPLPGLMSIAGALHGFAAPIQMTIGRDRVVGNRPGRRRLPSGRVLGERLHSTEK